MLTQQPARSAAQALALALACLALPAVAQTPAPAASNAPDPSVSDRVKKDAASPLYWIRLNAQKADAASTKAAPRITEVRSEPRAARAAPAQAAASPSTSSPPMRSTTAVAIGLGVLPADAASARESAAPPVMTDASPPAAAAGGLAGAAAAGLAAPGGPSAAETARTAAAQPPADDLDDQPLALVKAEEPEFPAHVMRKLRKGNVQVRFEVQADGSVANATVLQSSHRGLNDAALGAVAAWRFQPVRSARSAVVELGFDLDS